MSLRSKVIGSLLGVFLFYVLAAWLALEIVYTTAFDRLEQSSAFNQLNRTSNYIDAERAAVDLLVFDWAQWDDTMEFVQGEYPGFYEENLADSYLNDLGMDFGIIVDMQGSTVWGEFYPANKESPLSIENLFPQDNWLGSTLLHPTESGELTSGFINTAQGPAIISSAAILWNSGEGAPGGHMIAGKLLDAGRLETLSQTMLTTINILSIDRNALPQPLHQAHNTLVTEKERYTIIEQGENIVALTLLKDIADKPLGLLSIIIPAEISMLGTSTLHITISTLIIAALILTLTLWLLLKNMMLRPLEQLTAVFRGKDAESDSSNSGKYLLSTMQRLADARGSISERNDEIGELTSAFDDLSSSLYEATNSVWRAAHIDALTGLANRRLFVERLTNRIDTANSNAINQSILFIDLDGFKAINDKHGHDTGDQVLIEVASRLLYLVGTKDDSVSPEDDCMGNIVGRIGGDEFVLVLPSDKSSEHAHDIASKIVEAMASPFIIDENQCSIGASVGLAVYPQDADDLYGILSIADAAMYEAKRAGKSCWRRYVPGLNRYQNQKSA